MIILVSQITYADGLLTVIVKSNAEAAVQKFTENLGRKCATIKIEQMHLHRSTGWKSQNHHINGHCQTISMATGEDFDTVKVAMKYLAISRGYPFDTFKDRVIPWSEKRINTVQAGMLIDTIHQFADEWEPSIILQEE